MVLGGKPWASGHWEQNPPKIRQFSFVPLGFVPQGFSVPKPWNVALNKGIWNPTPKAANIKTTNLKSLKRRIGLQAFGLGGESVLYPAQPSNPELFGPETLHKALLNPNPEDPCRCYSLVLRREWGNGLYKLSL